MKKLVVLAMSLFVLSCSLSDDSDISTNVLLPIENAVLATEFERGEIYDIYLTYLRPSSCHIFNDIYFAAESNENTVAIIETYFNGPESCNELNEMHEAILRFKAGDEDSYVFKFWQGEDDNGDDQYLIIEVPVVD